MNEVLIIEDSETDAQLLRRVLDRAGILNPVRWVQSGEEALAYFATVAEVDERGPSAPTIALVDLKLPGISGFEVLERMQQHATFSKTLRLAISSLEDIHSIKRAYSCGAHSFLTKPADEAELRAVIHSFPGYWALPTAEGATPVEFSPLAW